MIRIRSLIVRFGRTTALRLERMDLRHRESVCVAGPNGSGKSTLMRVLAGLLPPTNGSVDGLPPPGQVVLVHQDPYFFTGTVSQNLAWALKRAGRHASETAVWLERAHARHLAERPASRVSGGEKRRLAIARALAVQPELLLLDEPFAGLDVKHRRIIDEELDGFDGTLVIASPDGAVHRAHRMIVLEPADPPPAVVRIR